MTFPPATSTDSRSTLTGILTNPADPALPFISLRDVPYGLNPQPLSGPGMSENGLLSSL